MRGIRGGVRVAGAASALCEGASHARSRVGGTAGAARTRAGLPAVVALLALAGLVAWAGAGHGQEEFPVAAGYSVPSDSLVPQGAMGESIRRGRAIVQATGDSLRGHVGNKLACTNCHREAGTRASSGPWVGSYASFPMYNARAGRVIRMEDRINECLRRSLNGKPLPSDGRDMNDMVAYMAFLSTGIPHGTRSPWLGYRRLAPVTADTAAGRTLYGDACARCHGPAGQGSAVAPPLWGPQSFAIGAGMARLGTIAAFVRWNMPFDRPGMLTDQQAYDVGSFVLAHPRPDTPHKERDWPHGDPPGDAAYPTLAARHAAEGPK